MVGLALSALSAQAAQDTFEYPELAVTPRASDRLNLEIQREAEGRSVSYLPLQISGGMTVLTGLMTLPYGYRDTSTGGAAPQALAAAGTAIAIGSITIASTFLLKNSRPYATGAEEVKRVNGSSVRDQLTRERFAEEALASASANGWKITIASTVLNMGASGFCMLMNQSGTMGQFTAIAGMVGSLLPLVLKFRWMDVYSDHLDYKKRIYGPVTLINAGPMMGYDAGTGRPIPMAGVALAF